MYPSLSRAGIALAAGLLISVAGCGGSDPVPPEKQVTTVEISPKSALMYVVGQEVDFSAQITTAAGTAGEGIEIGFIARDPSLLQVNSAGVAKVLKKGGSTYVVASAGGKADSALVEVPATPCGATAATTLGVGEVAADVAATGFCAPASSNEYTVIVHNNSLAQTGTSSFEITGIALSDPPATPGASLSRVVGGSSITPGPRHWRRDVAAEMRHRMTEQATMAPLAEAMRAAYAARAKRASFNAAPPAVGDVVSLNVNLNGGGCTEAPTTIAARVAAVSNSAIVLADPRNPGGGFTDAEYNEFAAMFDSIINPLDVANFGAPSDLDNNQHVLLVFTKAVNERTPAGANFYIGGLTHSRDLAPKSSCAGSNEAEMFYLLAADPSGIVNGNDFSKDFVKSVTDATIVHEYQHLINFSRRRYILPGAPQQNEELWLNEGLSHIAEELLYHRRTGHPTRANIGFNEIIVPPDPAFENFADYMGGNFLNYDDFALKSPDSSPFHTGDDSNTRGATWSFLRYIVDQKFSTDGTFWFNLVNSGQTGTTNIQNRLGTDAAGLRAMLRDFAIAVYADDYVSGIPAKYTQPSWNIRSIYPGLQGYPDFDFALPVSPLHDAEKRSLSITAGGIKIYRFKGMTGADSFIRITGASGAALPSSITMSVIRTK